MKKVAYNILLYSTFILFVIEDAMSIGVTLEMRTRFYISGVPSRDIALIIMLFIFLGNCRTILSIIDIKKIFFFISIVFIFTVQGLIINGFEVIPLIRADLRGLLWFLGGISFGLIFIRSGNVKVNLRIVVLIATGFMILGALYAIALETAVGHEIVDSYRTTDASIFVFMGVLLTPLIILFNIETNQLKNQIVPLVCIISFLYCGVYLTNTRSVGIMGVVILILYALSLGFKIVGMYISRIQIKRSIFIILMIFGIGLALFTLLLSFDPRLERLLNISAKSVSQDIRYTELTEFFDQSWESGSIILGQGLGGSIKSSIHPDDPTGLMHVGIFNVWMKMGIIPFILVIIFLFIKVPSLYMKTLINGAALPFAKRTANLVVIPSILPWLVGLAMSGGFAEVNFLFAGFAYFIYGEISNNGLRNILMQKR